MPLMSNFTISLCMTTPDGPTLEHALSQTPFCPPEGIETFRQGWAPISKQDVLPVQFTEHIEGLNATRCLFKHGAKKVPPSVLNEAAATEVKRIEDKEGRKVGRKERAQIKEQVRDTLLIDIFPTVTATNVLVFHTSIRHTSSDESNLTFLFIEGNEKARERVFSQLVADLRDKIALRIWTPKNSLRSAMTEWLHNDESVPALLGVGNRCKIKGSGDCAPVSTFNNEDLSRSFVQEQLDQGRTVESMELCFRIPDDIRSKEAALYESEWDASFVLSADGSFSKTTSLSADHSILSETFGDTADFYMAGFLMRELAEYLTEELQGLA